MQKAVYGIMPAYAYFTTKKAFVNIDMTVFLW